MPVAVRTPEVPENDESRPAAPNQSFRWQLPRSLTGRLTAVALACQRRLRQAPNDLEALIGMSLVALASRQYGAAVTMAQAGAAAAPQSAIAWIALGQALSADARMEEAEAAYLQAVRLDALNPLARMGLGELKIACGRPAEAIWRV